MRCRIKRLISFFLTVVTALTFSLSADAYQRFSFSGYHAANTSFVHAGSDVWLLSFEKKNVFFDNLSSSASFSLSLEYEVITCCLSGGMAYAVCDDTENAQLVVYAYSIADDVLDSFSVAGYTAVRKPLLAFGGGFYLQSQKETNVITRYSLGGKKEFSYRFDVAVSQIIPDFSSRVYAVSNRRLYRLDDSGAEALSGDTMTFPVSFLSDDIVADAAGGVFRLNGLTLTKLFSVDSTGEAGTAALFDGYVYVASGNTVTGYSVGSGEKERYLMFDEEVLALSVDSQKIYVLTAREGVSVNEVDAREFLDIPHDVANGDTNRDDNAVSPGVISSSRYSVNLETLKITGIPAHTTVAQFKKNLSFDGYDVTVFRGEKEVKSGDLGTAMTARFSGENTYVFELSVIGDLTGEGNVNSRDMKLLMKYVLKTAHFDGVYFTAADLNGDERLDSMDMAMLMRIMD